MCQIIRMLSVSTEIMWSPKGCKRWISALWPLKVCTTYNVKVQKNFILALIHHVILFILTKNMLVIKMLMLRNEVQLLIIQVRLTNSKEPGIFTCSLNQANNKEAWIRNTEMRPLGLSLTTELRKAAYTQPRPSPNPTSRTPCSLKQCLCSRRLTSTNSLNSWLPDDRGDRALLPHSFLFWQRPLSLQ